MITPREETIYNSYLYASRISKNKPFNPRSNFSSITDQDAMYLKKMSTFFKRYEHISLNDWFIAPYKVYGMDEYFDLHFYNTRKALKCFTTYIKQREVEDPDSDVTINRLKDGLHFIYNYCHARNITLDSYIEGKTGNLPTFLQHLKDHKITFYMLQMLEVEPILRRIEPSILNFIVSDFWTVFAQTRARFLSSEILKPKAKKGLNLIKTKLTVENQNK